MHRISHTYIILSLLLFLAIVVLFLFPLMLHAQGLVPCGGTGQHECGFNDLLVLIQTVINFLMFKVSMPLAAVAFTFAGAKLMMSGGNPNALQDAKGIFKTVLIGVLISLSAWLIVKLIVGTLLDPEYIILSLLYVSTGVV